MYKLIDNDSVIRLADGAYIPCDIGNRDYQDYLNWVKNGNTAEAEYDIDELKVQYISEAKAYRDVQEVATISYNGNDYDYDAKARERLNIARQALEDSGAESIDWTTAAGTDVTLTVADFAGINGEVALRSNTLHVNYRETKAKLEAATTVEELEQIRTTHG